MSLDTATNNLNFLGKNAFHFTLEKYKDFSYFVQAVNMPGVSIQNIDMQTPFKTLAFPGSTLAYENLTIEFVVDENMNNYLQIFSWMKGLGFPDSNTQYVQLLNESDSLTENSKTVSNARLMINNLHNNTIKTIEFRDVMPESLSSLDFSVNNTDIEYHIATVTFKYSSFDVV